MYNEIDLHQMNFDDALRVFITKYNSLYKKGERREIMVIHGYGSKFLESLLRLFILVTDAALKPRTVVENSFFVVTNESSSYKYLTSLEILPYVTSVFLFPAPG